MSKPKIILLVGIALALVITFGGIALGDRAAQRLKAIEDACRVENPPEGPWEAYGPRSTDKCSYSDIRWSGEEAIGIQAQILEAGDASRAFHEDNVYGTAFFVFFLSVLPAIFLEFIPWLWRFLLARIREVSDAIAGRTKS